MAPLPTPEDFDALAERLTAEMRAQGVEGNIAYDRANQRLLNESTNPIPLGDAIVPFVGAPKEELPELLHRYVAALLRGRPTIETWAEARTLVLPKVRPELEHALWPLRSRLEGWEEASLPTGAITEHVRAQFVWEIEDGAATVQTADVERWGVSLEALQEAAVENLARRTPNPSEWLGSPESPGVFRSKWRDGFDATRALFLRGLGLPFQGPPVAIATSDKDLLLADSADDAALFQLGLAAQRLQRKTLTLVWLWPLRLDDDGPRHWLPPESSASHAPLSMCAALHAQAVCNQHGTLLQRVLEAERSPLRVGLVGMIQNPLGSAGSVVVWSDGPPTLLARCDLVQLRRGEQVLGLVPWARVTEVMGAVLQPIPGYPERYRADLFPEDWQLAALGIG